MILIIKKLCNKKPVKILFYCITFLFVIYFFGTSIFEIYRVPTGSMKNTILPEDIVIVNKLKFGLRVKYKNIYYRALGYSQINRYDVIVFNLPVEDTMFVNRPYLNYYQYIATHKWTKRIDQSDFFQKKFCPITIRTPYIKRCIGLPGEIICLKNDSIYINNKGISEIKANNKVKSKYQEQFETYDLFLKGTNVILKWDENNMGPLYIPQQGDSIELTYNNIKIYKRIIENYEHNNLNTISGKVLINNKIMKYYMFKQNYYFMLGDNWSNSLDSRYWGFLPEDHIIGKAWYILYSNNGKTSTILKRIR